MTSWNKSAVVLWVQSKLLSLKDETEEVNAWFKIAKEYVTITFGTYYPNPVFVHASK